MHACRQTEPSSKQIEDAQTVRHSLQAMSDTDQDNTISVTQDTEDNADDSQQDSATKAPFNHHHALHVVEREEEFVPSNATKKKHSQEHTEKLYKTAKETEVGHLIPCLFVFCLIRIVTKAKRNALAEKQADDCTFHPSTSFVMKKGKIEAAPGTSPTKKTSDTSEKRYEKLYDTVRNHFYHYCYAITIFIIFVIILRK
jgi:hypothetical protein